ncbi:MAG TPA: FAD-dependent oxidoreductase [Candidatus Blautia intestinigallinarum]|nr:FAD-dependent oxidoreductase [Candidatus Blautia intestinigallinarum]
MIRLNQVSMPISHSEEALEKKIRKLLRLNSQEPLSYEIERRSLDARNPKEKVFRYTLDVTVKNEKKILKKVKNNNIMSTEHKRYHFPPCGEESLRHRPVIVGGGPAGLFCGWYLAHAGYRPLILERGQTARERKKTVETFWETGTLQLNSNVQFGEGGAGTFSDGKLNTLVKDPSGRNKEVLRRFVKAGAPKEILYEQKPHLGTDLLVPIVETLRRQIESMGGEFRFETQVTDLRLEDGRLTGVVLRGGEEIPAQVCVLAIGHSARDTFAMLHERKIPMEPKAFAVGVRMEHPQELINQALYGEKENPYLGAASYKVTHQTDTGRGVYSFCMCPGGYVVNASSEEGMLAVNGMSYQARDSRNANSALIVTVRPEDFGEPGVLGGVAFQRKLEKAAYEAGRGKIPVQTFGDFCAGQKSRILGEMRPCMKGGWALANVRAILPDFVGDAIEEGVYAFDRKIRGFASYDALVSGVESRTSSPVRILRGNDLQSEILGIYPCGEGAGYAGGITSAAMDGIKVAEAIARKYAALGEKM